MTLQGEALLRFLFHVSMGFGLVACYALVGTALGYRATERVEQVVTPDEPANIEAGEEVQRDQDR